MKVIVVIPARFSSSRFPGKPLVDICGKSMLQRVYEQCLKAVDKEQIIVATEDNRIVQHCEEKNMNCMITSDKCLTGTDRVAEVAQKINADYYVNVQGDEPVFNPEDLKKLIHTISHNLQKTEIYNGFCPIDIENDFFNFSLPKVVVRKDNRLLYMSRSGIPGNKSGSFNLGYRQVCIYAFTKNALLNFASQTKKTPFEEEEDIEILRFLELGYDIQMIPMSSDSIPVDHKEDLEKVINRINGIS